MVDVFDVGGRVVAVTGAYPSGAFSAEEMAELHGIVESVEIRP